MENLGSRQPYSTLLRCDNESTINLAYNPLAYKGSKHIKVSYHYIREQVIEGTIRVVYVNTKYQLADVLTKALDGGGHEKCLNGFGLIAVPEVAI